MKNYVSKAAVCPFYHQEKDCSVHCEGVMKGSSLKLSFVTRAQFEKFRKEKCYGQWEQCPVAKMLLRKYQ